MVYFSIVEVLIGTDSVRLSLYREEHWFPYNISLLIKKLKNNVGRTLIKRNNNRMFQFLLLKECHMIYFIS